MRRLLTAVLAVSLVAACNGGMGNDSPTSTESVEVPTPQVMAVALVELITEDNTFGDGPPPFTEYLIQSKTDIYAGDAMGAGRPDRRDLTEEERAAIEEAISKIGPMRWIDNPNEWRTEDLMPLVEGSVILGVGEPTVTGSSALVPVSLWCSGLCGTWLSYRVDLRDGTWVVTGIEGPVTVS